MLAVSSLNLGQLNIGLGLGYSSVLIPRLKENTSRCFNEDKFLLTISSLSIVTGVSEASWIASVISVGMVGGSLLGAALGTFIGEYHLRLSFMHNS